MIDHPYGIKSEVQLSRLEVELVAFRRGLTRDQGGLGKPAHFWKIVKILWPKDSPKEFSAHPWAVTMVEALCTYDYLGIIGAGSSGKTDCAAVWAIINWLCDPENTLVLCTSTSLKDSRKRIWGSVTAYFQAVPGLPGRLVDSIGMIRTLSEDGSANNDKQGIALIAGEKSKEKEAIGKLIGMKNSRVFLLADELPELSEAILEAAYSNLSLNPYFQLVGIGNFNSLYDPLGVFVRPKLGYGSISPEDQEWETERGHCIRFDGLKSPYIDDPDYKGPIYSFKKLVAHRQTLGENSAAFWRMCRSFPCPEGEDHCIYSDSDFVRGDAHGSVIWMYEPTPVAGVDPAFTNGGDKFAVVWGLFGMDHRGKQVLLITGFEYIFENVELSLKGAGRDIQTATELALKAKTKHVPNDCLASDASGPGGLAFGSILSMVWSPRFHPVKFGESPSKRPVSDDDPKLCSDAFFNRSAELWFAGRNFIRSGQIKGLPVEAARQLRSRQYTTIKSGANLKMKIEPKDEMKARIHMSPDLADAFLILVDLCRERFGFTAGNQNVVPVQKRSAAWNTLREKVHSIYNPDNAYAPSR
jgi:hypothetical protein